MASDDESANSGKEDWDDSFLCNDWADEPKCSNTKCGNTNLHFSSSLIICLGCRSIESSYTTSSIQAAFPYRTLQEDFEFRLLLIWPPRDDEDEIHCSLICSCVNKSIAYDTVSYTWADETGNDSRSQHVFIDRVPFLVTLSCKAVLKRTRLRSTVKVLWIDSVCINQDDKDERGHQVRLMPDIYSYAKKVLIFPGEATEEESQGLYYFANLDTFHSQLCKGKGGEKLAFDIWKSVQRTVQHLFSRRYFTRMWILQEIALAKEPIVIYGNYEVPWHTIRSEVLHSLGYYTGSVKYEWSYNLGLRLLPQDELLPKALALGTATIRDPSDLLDLLDKVRDSQARDPRDKVFALFGMIQFASKFGFIANYNESVKESFARVAILLAARVGLMPILLRTISRQPPRSRQHLPSWVPDWSSKDWYVEQDIPFDGSGWNWTYWRHFTWPPVQPLKGLADVPVLARPGDYEMDFIGAPTLCNLGRLLDADFNIDLLTATQGVFYPQSRDDLEPIYLALDSSWADRSSSLFRCYLPLTTMGDQVPFSDEEAFVSKLKRLLEDKSAPGVEDYALSRLQSRCQCELIISSGDDGFKFAGLLIISCGISKFDSEIEQEEWREFGPFFAGRGPVQFQRLTFKF